LPLAITSVRGRIALAAGLSALAVIFSWWFTAPGVFFGYRRPDAAPDPASLDPQEPGPRLATTPTLPYPSVQDGVGHSPAAPPREDPDGDRAPAPGRDDPARIPMLSLLEALPEGHSLFGMADLDRLRQIPVVAEVLEGRRLCRVQPLFERLGVPAGQVGQIVWSADLEGGKPPRVPSETRFLPAYDRAFYALLEGPRLDRPQILRQFRQGGALSASMIFGRRVYHRTGEYSLAFARPGLAVWSYHRPLGPLLQILLDDTPPSPQRRTRLLAAGLGRDGPLPLAITAYFPPTGRKLPWVFQRLGGAALRQVVAFMEARGSLLRGEVHLLHADEATAQRVAGLLRWLRRAVADYRRVRQVNLMSAVQAATVKVEGSHVSIILELQPWQVSELIVLLHKLLGCSTGS
jgi:hypothetical protein